MPCSISCRSFLWDSNHVPNQGREGEATVTHTPGPWRYSPSTDAGSDKFNGEYTISGSNEHGGSVLPILGRTHNWPKNAEANARLIAAAPELLKALEAIRVMLTTKLAQQERAIALDTVLHIAETAIAEAK